MLHILRRTAAPGRIVVVATLDERLLPIADDVVELSPVPRPAESIELAAGQILFAEGEAGEIAYVVDKGEIELTRIRADGTEQIVHRARPDQYFGELAPLFPHASQCDRPSRRAQRGDHARPEGPAAGPRPAGRDARRRRHDPGLSGGRARLRAQRGCQHPGPDTCPHPAVEVRRGAL